MINPDDFRMTFGGIECVPSAQPTFTRSPDYDWASVEVKIGGRVLNTRAPAEVDGKRVGNISVTLKDDGRGRELYLEIAWASARHELFELGCSPEWERHSLTLDVMADGMPLLVATYTGTIDQFRIKGVLEDSF